MADGLGSKVSILPETETLDDSDLIYVVSGGASKKMTVGNAKTEFGGGGGGGSDGVIEGLDYDRAETLTLPDFTGYTYTPTEDGVLMLKAYGGVGGVAIEATGDDTLMLAVLGDTWTCPWIPVNKSTEYTLKRMAQSSGFPSDSWLKFIPWKRGVFLAPMIYSFEEREIGVWTDGKPLYQRTFTGTNSGGGNINIEWDKSNIDVKNIFGEYITSSGSVRAMPFSASSTWHRIYADELHIGILVETNVTGVAYVTAQYTKKSDVPGSGKYGSLGVPMVHYDNTERVVGTYFGKTLYQKSYTNFSSLTGQSRTLDFGLSGIDKIWYVSEGCVISDGLYPFPYIHWDPSNVVGGFWNLNDGSPTFAFRTGSQSTSAVINTFTIRYTKTTD